MATFALALALLTSGGCMDCARAIAGCGNEDSDLERASRPLGTLSLGDRTLRVNAQLRGRYARIRGGGGRMGYSCVTNEENWTLSLGFESDDDAPVISFVGGSMSRADRDDGVAGMESMSLEPCPGATRERVLFKVVGWPDAPILRLDRSPGGALVLSVASASASEAPPTECAAATALARAWPDHAHVLWTDSAQGVDGILPGGFSRHRAHGAQLCEVRLVDGAVEEGLLCSWALEREAAESSAEDGRYSATIAALLAPGEQEPTFEALDEGIQTKIMDGLARVGGGYVLTLDEETRRPFVARVVEVCGSEACPPHSSPDLGCALCAPNPLEASTSIGIDDRPQLCALAARSALSLLRDGPARASPNESSSDPTRAWRTRALALLRPIRECGEEPILRDAFERALTLPTIARTDRPPSVCTPEEFASERNQGRHCRSLPIVAGEWLGRHCADSSATRAVEAIASLPPEDRNSPANTVLDGSVRLLARCDPSALLPILDAMDPLAARLWAIRSRICAASLPEFDHHCRPPAPPTPPAPPGTTGETDANVPPRDSSLSPDEDAASHR